MVTSPNRGLLGTPIGEQEPAGLLDMPGPVPDWLALQALQAGLRAAARNRGPFMTTGWFGEVPPPPVAPREGPVYDDSRPPRGWWEIPYHRRGEPDADPDMEFKDPWRLLPRPGPRQWPSPQGGTDESGSIPIGW